MEVNSPTLLIQKSRWNLCQNINREFFKSYSGVLQIAEMSFNKVKNFTWCSFLVFPMLSTVCQISLATCFGALLHYVNLVAETTVTDTLFFVTTGVVYFVTLILFLATAFDLQYKITRSTKNWNFFMAIFTLVSAVTLLTSSSLLVREAAKLGDSYHHSPYQDKCLKCSKINIATVFGFLSWLLFTVDFFLHMRQHGFPCSKQKGRRVTVQQVSPAPENEQEQEAQPSNVK